MFVLKWQPLIENNHLLILAFLLISPPLSSIAPAANGIVRKRVSSPSDSEVIAYRGLSADVYASKVIPRFFGVRDAGGDYYIELQDLLHGFKEPNVMDVKIGCRTFLENEVVNNTSRPDLYQKMIAVDPLAPTAEEHEQQAVTKLRYMLFRENMSSSASKGFRIEAMKMRGQTQPMNNLKTVKSTEEVQRTVAGFLQNRKSVTKELAKRLRQMRSFVEKSEYFQRHEVVGSSIFIVYDEDRIGAWMIDFAKSHALPVGVKTTHRRQWVPGNHEEGLLHGFDELIKTVENIYSAPATKLGAI